MEPNGEIKIKDMYTFEDWLNGKISEKAPGGDNLVDDVVNGLDMLYGHKLISKEDYNKILEAKRWAYDTALYYSVECLKKHTQERLSHCEDKKLFLELELQRANKILEENPQTLQGVIAGTKNCRLISYSEYRKIEKEYKRFKEHGQCAARMLDAGNKPDLNYLVKLNYELKKWVEARRNEIDKKPLEKDIEPIPEEERFEYNELSILEGCSGTEVGEIIFFLWKRKKIRYPKGEDFKTVGNLVGKNKDNIRKGFHNLDHFIDELNREGIPKQKTGNLSERLEKYQKLFAKYPAVYQDITQTLNKIS